MVASTCTLTEARGFINHQAVGEAPVSDSSLEPDCVLLEPLCDESINYYRGATLFSGVLTIRFHFGLIIKYYIISFLRLNYYIVDVVQFVKSCFLT